MNLDLDILVNLTKGSLKDKHETRTFLVDYFKKDGLNVFDASEKAETHLRHFIEAAQEYIDNCNEINCSCIFNDVNWNILTINRNYFKVLGIKSQLQNLTWQEFEDFCGLLVRKCFKVENILITQRSNDGGVDFKGKIPLKPKYSKSPYGYIELFGQAKKYACNIGRPEVDLFTAYANRQKRDNRYPAQLFLLFTTSDFVSSARDEIKKNNFIGLNGLQLATLVFNQLCEENIEQINLSNFK